MTLDEMKRLQEARAACDRGDASDNDRATLNRWLSVDVLSECIKEVERLDGVARHHMEAHYGHADSADRMRDAIHRAFPLSIAEYDAAGMTTAASLRRSTLPADVAEEAANA